MIEYCQQNEEKSFMILNSSALNFTLDIEFKGMHSF